VASASVRPQPFESKTCGYSVLGLGRMAHALRTCTFAGRCLRLEGRLSEGATKTRKGQRCVPLPRTVADALTEHLRQYPSVGLVFTGPEGGQIRRTLFRGREWVPALKAAGITKQVRVHDLRHSAATLLIQSGGDLNTVAAILGHSDPGFTLRTYGHTDNERAALLMASLGPVEETDEATVVALGEAGQR
jgi:integrase